MRSWLGRGKSLQFGITVCCLAAFILFGYEQGVFGPILQNEDWLELFNRPSDSQTGIIVACYNLGCMVGCVVAFVVGEKTGRRRAIWIAMTFVVIGTTLQTTSFHVAHLVIGRIITGVGTGLKTATVPMYQSELCTPTSRGRLVSAEVLFVGVGIVFAYWFNFGMSFVGGPIAWRLPIALQALFAILVIILVFALPESPRWLFNHGREAEAIETLCAVYDMQPTDEFIQSERAAILQAIEAETGGTIFKRNKNRTGYRVFLAWLIQLVNQISGINMVVYYIPTVLEENVGMTVQRSQIIGGCINMMFMFGSILPSLALDRMGRRKTMLWGCFGLGTCMLFISALLSQSDGGKTDRGLSFASASVAFFFLYQLIFGMSVNCVPWVYVPELLPLEARTKGSAIGISSNWLWNFTVVLITPVIVRRLQWKAYLIFMATNYAFIPMIYFLFPETSNLRLEDIDQIFSTGGDPVKVARKIKADARTGTALDAEVGNESKDAGEIETVEKAKV
ncbi:MFS domain-containing protein [Fusarium keratoplasticum]|nr:MFS domain-containing protein [Fusarium keratoplasticum]